MVAFCREHGIAHEQCGKIVVATEPHELERLENLWKRGNENGLQGLRKLNPAQIKEILRRDLAGHHALGHAAVRERGDQL